MKRFTPIVAGLLFLGVYPISAEDISVEDLVKPDLRAIGQTQGAGVPNAIGTGAFVPLHSTPNAVTYVDVEAKANLDDRSGDSSIINTDVAGITLSTSTRVGYRWINDVGSWMYGVYGGYDTRELKAGSVDTNVLVTDPRTVHFQQFAVGAEAVSNQWSIHAYALIPRGATEKQLNSYYGAGALDTVGADVGYQINEKTKATVGYYDQSGDAGEADGSGVTTGLSYDINDNLTAGVKVSYDDAFETRVMASINYTFGNLIQGDEEEKEAGLNWLMNALSASPDHRDVRVHDTVYCQRHPNTIHCRGHKQIAKCWEKQKLTGKSKVEGQWPNSVSNKDCWHLKPGFVCMTMPPEYQHDNTWDRDLKPPKVGCVTDVDARHASVAYNTLVTAACSGKDEHVSNGLVDDTENQRLVKLCGPEGPGFVDKVSRPGERCGWTDILIDGFYVWECRNCYPDEPQGAGCR